MEGFNMQGSSGHLTFYAWPPTGDKDEVTPTGDDLDWTGVPETEGDGYHFLNGPYQLEPGHYRVEAYDDHDGHPGHESHFVKAKMFWVDDCETGEPVCPEGEPECEEPEVECPEDTPAEECEVIPFFPSAMAGAAGLLGCVGAYSVMRRKTAT